MAAAINTLRKAFATGVEQGFDARLLWPMFTNTTYQVVSQGADWLDIVRPDASGIARRSGDHTSGGVTPGSWASNTRNLDSIATRQITTSRQRMFLRDIYRDAVEIGAEDLYDVPVSMPQAAGDAVGRLTAEVINDYLMSEFEAGIPTSSPDNDTTVGSATNYCPLSTGTFTGADADQATLYNALRQAELSLQARNIIDTGTVNYQMFMVMHPAHWYQIKTYILSRNFFTDRFGQIEAGSDVASSRVAGNLFGFPIYLDTEIELVSASPDYVPIFFGNQQALSFALSDTETFIYPPGTAQGKRGWIAEYARRFGSLMVWDDLAFQIRVAAAAD